MDREITVILYADVVGYSRLVGVDEERTHRQLNAALSLLIEQITSRGGKKVHEAGDAVLAEFSSVTSAVGDPAWANQQMPSFTMSRRTT